MSACLCREPSRATATRKLTLFTRERDGFTPLIKSDKKIPQPPMPVWAGRIGLGQSAVYKLAYGWLHLHVVGSECGVRRGPGGTAIYEIIGYNEEQLASPVVPW